MHQPTAFLAVLLSRPRGFVIVTLKTKTKNKKFWEELIAYFP
jgi:hypothetical protein